jgi:hypothetical protein
MGKIGLTSNHSIGRVRNKVYGLSSLLSSQYARIEAEVNEHRAADDAMYPSGTAGKFAHRCQSILNQFLPTPPHNTTHTNKCEKRGKNSSQIATVAQKY